MGRTMSIVVTVASALVAAALLQVVLGDGIDLTLLAVVGCSVFAFALWSSSGDERHAESSESSSRILAATEEIRDEEVEQTALLREQNRLLRKVVGEDTPTGDDA